MGFTLNQLEQERQIRKLQKKEDKDTSNYEQLSNLPKINNVELKGNKTTSDLGINADNVMMSDGVTSVEDALDNAAKKAETATDVTITTSADISIERSRIMKMDKLIIAQLRLQWSNPSINTEYKVLEFTGFDVGSYYAVGVITDTNINIIGAFLLTGNKLYVRVTSSSVTSATNLCMTVIGFNTL